MNTETLKIETKFTKTKKLKFRCPADTFWNGGYCGNFFKINL